MTAAGCTVVACAATSCCTALHAPLMSALRSAVRSSMHGVLVTSGCQLGPLACRTRPHGPLILIQPCDQHRRPIGCAMLVGPFQVEADVAAVVDWLHAGRFDPAALPAHLRTAQRAVHGAVQN